jgi:hypothetical protein
VKSSHAALAVVGLALVGLWYAAGGTAPPQASATEPRVSAPLAHDNLTVYFVHGPDAITNAKIATLQEALDAGWAVVHETGDVNTLAVENLSSEYELFIQEGDMIKGGKQDRMIAVDMLVPPRSGRVPFPAHCVESGRWTNRGGEAATHFTKSDQFAVGNELRIANAAGQQGEVWKTVKVQQDKLSMNVGVNVNSAESETSLQLALENGAVRAKVAEFEQALRAAGEKRPNVIGVVFVLNGQVRGHEEYGSNALFLKAWPKLLRSAAADAVAEKTAKATPPAPSVREVERFLAYGGQTHYDAGTRGPIDLGTITDGTSNGPDIVAARERIRQGLENVRARTDNPRDDLDRLRLVRDQQDLAVRTLDIANRFPGQTPDQVLNESLGNVDAAMRGRANEGRIDEARLRQIAESWSGQGPQDRARQMEELLRQLPPRYRQLVEEYFRTLNRASGQQVNGEELTRAIGAIIRQQINEEVQRARPLPTGGVSGLLITGDSTTNDRVLLNNLEPAPRAASRANPQGNRLNVNRVDGAAGLVTESRDPSRQNAVIHKSFIKK